MDEDVRNLLTAWGLEEYIEVFQKKNPALKDNIFELAKLRTKTKDKNLDYLTTYQHGSEEASNIACLLLMPSLVAVTSVRLKNSRKKIWCPSKAEATASFAQHVKNDSDIHSAIAKFTAYIPQIKRAHTHHALNMEKNKCRICLNRRKRLRSLHDTLEKVTGITYAVIVASISNVKVLKNDEMSNEICLTCCRRITDIYEFKCQIERSDMELQKTCQIKRIIFADIQDIKCKIEINENDSKYEKPLQSYLTEKFVQSTKKSLNYNSTIINRLKIKTPDSALEKSIPVTENLDSFKEDPDNENELKIKTLDSALKKSFLVTEYLDSIKEDPDSENDNADDGNVDYDPESESSVEEQNDEIEDEDYKPIKKYCYKKKAKSKKPLTNTDSYDAKKQMMCIKPVYIKDRVDYYNTRRTSETTHRKQSLYVCPICGVMVKFPKSHMLTHLNRERCAKCDQCSKSFYTKYSLIKHLKIHGKRDYQCDRCVATFYCKSLLKQHIKFHEGSVPRFPCEICSKTFRSKNHLWRHCQGVHNMGTKRFACDQCPMTFITKVNLNHHIRIHTRERPYKCEICSQPYSYKRDFDRHCLKKHGVSLKGRKVNIMNEEFMAKEKL